MKQLKYYLFTNISFVSSVLIPNLSSLKVLKGVAPIEH
jgi:hypothetical protein